MKLVVLDRDGVINHDSPDFIRSAAQWRPIEGSLDAIADLQRGGFSVAVATNQSGLARGLFDSAALEDIHWRMRNEVAAAGGHIAHIAICPHHPEDGCCCRKPRPGMIDRIFASLGVPETGWMIGDRMGDLEAGAARGLRPILVRTGRGAETIGKFAGSLPHECLIADDLRHAVSMLIGASATGALDAAGETLANELNK